jgi:hypothetical protein
MITPEYNLRTKWKSNPKSSTTILKHLLSTRTISTIRINSSTLQLGQGCVRNRLHGPANVKRDRIEDVCELQGELEEWRQEKFKLLPHVRH